MSGTLFGRLDEYDAALESVPEMRDRIHCARQTLEAAVAHVRELGDSRFREFRAGSWPRPRIWCVAVCWRGTLLRTQKDPCPRDGSYGMPSPG